MNKKHAAGSPQFGLGGGHAPAFDVGARVILCNGNPYAGRSGLVNRVENTPFGQLPVVRMDGGGEAFIRSQSDARVIG